LGTATVAGAGFVTTAAGFGAGVAAGSIEDFEKPSRFRTAERASGSESDFSFPDAQTFIASPTGATRINARGLIPVSKSAQNVRLFLGRAGLPGISGTNYTAEQHGQLLMSIVIIGVICTAVMAACRTK
jgi:hypothetical protein